MSERKVLNKYYPPDFDPSQIPRCKEPRNKTFIIRLMAPCNMRCTTCGEYIYKGRKFNARKEDVDDMNFLGLRIYRFYIKCTACGSEIAFRTDPENTDYVLEAGATRNFEALAKAEKMAEQEQRAHEEELKSNPMKLLEERTQASKHEMERMEALEELQQLNKRHNKVDYEDMLKRYELEKQERERIRAEKEREEEEQLVNQIFAKEGNKTVKRILDDDEEDDDKDDEERTKKLRMTLGTKKESWERSVGSFSSLKKATKKNNLVLVKRSSDVSKKKSVDYNKTKTDVSNGALKKKDGEDSKNGNSVSDNSESKKSVVSETDKSHVKEPLVGLTGLGLVSAYSDDSE